MRKISNAFFVAVCLIVLIAGCESSKKSSGDDEFESTGGTGYTAATASRYIKILEGTFVAGNEPTSSGAGPTLTSVDGMFSLVNGGSGNFVLKFTHPEGLENIKEAIVAVERDPGYFVVPIADPSSGEFTINIFIREDIRYNSISIKFAVKDAAGNISNYITKTIIIILTGTGDVKVSLTFDRNEDLDLHVWEPKIDGSVGGEHIYFANKNSATGGILDLDSNAACSIDAKNNENIYWPSGSAPAGTYQVQVHYWAHCTTGDPVPANWIITIIVKGEVTTYSGLFLDTEENLYKPIPAIEFTYTPSEE